MLIAIGLSVNPLRRLASLGGVWLKQGALRHENDVPRSETPCRHVA